MQSKSPWSLELDATDELLAPFNEIAWDWEGNPAPPAPTPNPPNPPGNGGSAEAQSIC